MRKVEALHQLQAVDSALDKARERLEEVQQQLADRHELDEAIVQFDVAQRELRHREAEQRDLDLQVDELRAHLKQINDKLYSGSVRNPKELNDISKDAQQLGRQISAKEDILLACYEGVEQATAVLASARSQNEHADRDWRERQERLGVERSQLEADLSRHEQQQESLRAALDAPSLRIYNGLRRTRGGLAVVEVRQRTCQGCRISLPMTEEHRVRTSQDLVLCQSCGRILYATA